MSSRMISTVRIALAGMFALAMLLVLPGTSGTVAEASQTAVSSVSVAISAPAATTAAGDWAGLVATAGADDSAEGAAVQAPTPQPLAGQIGRKNSKGTALLFWFFAIACVVGSIFVVTRRNLIAAVMGMVGTFFAVAAAYTMLYAHFLAVVQVLVYAGAIMVLFIFVIMIMNRPEAEPWGKVGLPGKILALAASGYFLFRLISVLWNVVPPSPDSLDPGTSLDQLDFGSVFTVGEHLFRNYLFAFEAVSLVLLVAVVGAIMIARPVVTGADSEDHADSAAGEA